MISDLDIWRAANLLIRKHGADAELEAARLQDLMLDRGDDEGRHCMAADQAGDRGAAGAAVWQAELTPAGAEVQMSAFPMNGRPALAAETTALHAREPTFVRVPRTVWKWPFARQRSHRFGHFYPSVPAQIARASVMVGCTFLRALPGRNLPTGRSRSAPETRSN